MRYASWTTSPGKRKYLSYTSYLQSNPMEYGVQVEDDYHEASYCLVDRRLYLQGTRYQIEPWVNLGIIKPEEKLFHEATFLHDITQKR